MAAVPKRSALAAAAALLCLCVGITSSQSNTECTNPLGRPGICVDVKLCPYLLDMLTSNITAADLQYLRNSSCDPSNPSHVCCDRQSCATADGHAGACVERRMCPARSQSDVGACAAGSVCCRRRTLDGYLSRRSGLPVYGFCGVGAPGPRFGNASAPGQFPWTALLVYGGRQDGGERCGGALISARFVLTAAHCLEADLVKVRLGVRDLAERCADVRGGCPFTADVAAALAAPTYDAATRADDIALLRLATPAPYTDHIRPICLPDNTLSAALQRSPELQLAGWGVSQELSGNELEAADNIQSFATVPLRSASVCRQALEMWAKILAPYQQHLDASVPPGAVCAGGTFSGELCAQDSGGALAHVGGRGGARLVALHARAVAGCRAPLPAVYTPVPPHVPWIQSTVARHYSIV